MSICIAQLGYKSLTLYDGTLRLATKTFSGHDETDAEILVVVDADDVVAVTDVLDADAVVVVADDGGGLEFVVVVARFVL